MSEVIISPRDYNYLKESGYINSNYLIDEFHSNYCKALETELKEAREVIKEQRECIEFYGDYNSSGFIECWDEDGNEYYGRIRCDDMSFTPEGRESAQFRYGKRARACLDKHKDIK